jgi:hypothetical protein
MAFVKPSSITVQSGSYSYKKGISSPTVNYIDNSFPNILDKTGDSISGSIIFLSGSTLTAQSGSSLQISGTFNAGIGSTFSLNGAVSGTTTSGTLHFGGSTIIDFDTGTTLNLGNGSITNLVGGSQTNVDSTAYIEFKQGSILQCDQGSFMNLFGALAVRTNQIGSSGTSYTCDSGSFPDYIVLVNTSANTKAITLPAPQTGRSIVIKDNFFNAFTLNITVLPHSTEKIDGQTSYVIHVNGGVVSLVSNGTDWFVTSQVA